MLDQNTNSPFPVGFANFDLNSAPPQPQMPFAHPLSVPAPRAASTPPGGPAKLSELVARAESAMAHLEKRLEQHATAERAAQERAARASSDLDERLRLGVRMLQAIDVQVDRGEKAARGAQDSMARADEVLRASSATTEASMQACAERLAREKLEWIERELSWRFDRVKEVEERIDQAANGKLAWLDEELGKRLARIDESCARAQGVVQRAEHALAQLGCGADAPASGGEISRPAIVETIARAEQATDRAERATAALAGLVSEGQRHLESLVSRTGDATHLREALGTLVHELAAAREFVQGDLRRMRDDLGWLVEKGERLGGELVERADHAASVAGELRAAAASTEPTLAEFAALAPLLDGSGDDRLRPLADALSSAVRDELAADMRGFSAALRQMATRADSAFGHMRIDPSFMRASAVRPHGTDDTEHPRELARTIAHEVARLAPVHAHGGMSAASPTIEIAPPSGIAVNRPIEIEAAPDDASANA